MRVTWLSAYDPWLALKFEWWDKTQKKPHTFTATLWLFNVAMEIHHLYCKRKSSWMSYKWAIFYRTMWHNQTLDMIRIDLPSGNSTWLLNIAIYRCYLPIKMVIFYSYPLVN